MKQIHCGHRLLSFLLCICMVLSLMPSFSPAARARESASPIRGVNNCSHRFNADGDIRTALICSICGMNYTSDSRWTVGTYEEVFPDSCMARFKGYSQGITDEIVAYYGAQTYVGEGYELSFDWAINQGYINYGQFMMELYHNDTKVLVRDFTENVNPYRNILSEVYSFTAGEETQIFKFVFRKIGRGNWADDGRHAYLNHISLAYEMPPEIDGVYQIGTASELFRFAQEVNSGNNGIHGVLTAPIDLGDREWTPMGSDSNRYTGSFDGNGYGITGFKMSLSTEGNWGLFGYVENATVKNFSIEGSVSVNLPEDTDMGFYYGVVGQAYATAGKDVILQNITSRVDLAVKDAYMKNYVAGIVGAVGASTDSVNWGNVCLLECVFTGSIHMGSAPLDCGGGIVGYVGYNVATYIENCLYAGSFTGANGQVGGIAGYGRGQNIRFFNCLSVGRIYMSEPVYVGAIAGRYRGQTNDRVDSFVRNNYYAGELPPFSNDPNMTDDLVDHGSFGEDNACKTYDSQLASGELACLLGSAWGQSIGSDTYPVPGGARVYYGYADCTEVEKVYSNDPSVAESKPMHVPSGYSCVEAVTCLLCGTVLQIPPGHNWKEATCTAPKTCMVCGIQEGEPGDNHSSEHFTNGFRHCCGEYERPSQDEFGTYFVGNAGQLYWVAQQVNSGDAELCFKLTDNIVVNEGLMESLDVASDGTVAVKEGAKLRNWIPIGFLCGSFDGQGYTISGLYYNDPTGECVGLIGKMSDDATVKRVNIRDSLFLGGDYVGAFVGRADDFCKLYNCSNTATVIGRHNVGGMIGFSGYASGVENCYNMGTVIGQSNVGGLIGEGYVSHLQYSYCAAPVMGKVTVGALIGYRNGGYPKYCYFDTELTEAPAVGYSEDESPLDATVLGKSKEDFASGEVAYLLGKVQGETFWGQNLDNGQPVETYPVFSHATVYGSFKCDGQTILGYTNRGTSAEPHCVVNCICTVCGGKVHQEESGYNEQGLCPVCEAYEPAVRNGEVYEIYTVGNLYWFSEFVNGKSLVDAADPSSIYDDLYSNCVKAKLMNDIVINEDLMKKLILAEDGTATVKEGYTLRSWTPIGNQSVRYNGSFDGNGKTISGLYCGDSNESCVALFGATDYSFKIVDLHVADSYFIGYSFVAAIVAENRGKIQNCSSHAFVRGMKQYTGGIAGRSEGSIIACSNRGTVMGEEEYIGGIAGYNSETLNCYNFGSVIGDYRTGGVAGNSNTMANCYNYGTVEGGSHCGSVVGEAYGFVGNCYYNSDLCDLEPIGYEENAVLLRVEPKTTEQFACGEVAYLLQQGVSREDPFGDGELFHAGDDWGQNLDNGQPVDGAPVFSSAKVHYGYPSCAEDAVIGYTNTPDSQHKPSHNIDGNGSCAGCGKQYAVCTTVEGITLLHESLRDGIETLADCTAEDKAVVTLLTDLTLSEGKLSIAGGSFTLDLNSHSLSAPGDLLSIEGASEVTVKNGTLHSHKGTAIAVSNAEVNILDCKIISGADPAGEATGYGLGAVVIDNGTVSICGGSIDCSGTDISKISPEGKVSLILNEDGEGTSFVGGIRVEGLTLCEITGDGLAYWQGGSMLRILSEDREILGGNVSVQVACIHKNGKLTYCVTAEEHTCTYTCCGYSFTEKHSYDAGTLLCACGAAHDSVVALLFNHGTLIRGYTDLQESLAQMYGIFDDPVIKLLKSIDFGSGFLDIRGGNFVFDLNGFTLSSACTIFGCVLARNAGELRIINGTIEGTACGLQVVGSNVTLSDLTIKGQSAINSCSVDVLTVENCTLQGGNHGLQCDDSKAVVRNCVFYPSAMAEIQLHGDDAAVELQEGTVFMAGVRLEGGTLQAVLSEGMAYWVGNIMLKLRQSETRIPVGEVTVRAVCDHGGSGADSCGNCDGSDPATLDPTIKLSHSLNLASDISVNFVIPAYLLEGYDMSTVYVESTLDNYQGETILGTETVRMEPVEMGSYYYFTLTGITAVQMNDTVSTVLYGKKDGRAYYSNTDLYSVARYAYSQLEKDITLAPASLKTLCADLLRYGSTAQIYKNYRVSSLADGNMTDAHRQYLSDLEAVKFGNNNADLGDLANAPITWVGKTLDLDSKVCLKFVFNTSHYTGSLEDLSLRVKYRDIYGEEMEATVTELTAYDPASDRYAFSVDALLASELREVVSVQIYEGENPVSSTYRYSADTYGNNKAGTLLKLCKALFAYSDSAKAYFVN